VFTSKEKLNLLKSKSATKSKSVYFDPFLDLKCSYMCPTEINDEFLSPSSSFSIFHNNIRSLNKNFHKIKEIFQGCSSLPPILALSETKLNETSRIPPLDGFNFIHSNSTTSCGGVGFYITDTLRYLVRQDLSLNINACEDLWIEVFPDVNKSYNIQESIVFGVVYRHPDHKYDNFCEKLCAQLDSLNSNKKDYYICGDININIMKYNIAENVTDYMTAISSMGCNIMIDKPTRITPNGGTCIDHLYTNLNCDVIDIRFR